MAVAMDAFGKLMATRGTVIRIRTVPGFTPSRQLHHLRRLPVVLAAIAKLLMLRRNSREAVLSVDAGSGMVYTILLTLAARCTQYGVTLQHHSYAYISRRSRLMALLVVVAGRSATHMFTCEQMRDDFRRNYARLSASEVVSVAYALRLPVPQERGMTRRRPLTLGHMSNLSVDKGLVEVIKIAKEAVGRGLADKLILAGPVTSSRAQEVLKRAPSTAGVEHRGYISGAAKEQFFRDIDVFLFPSRYKNESFGLVVWEAMLCGVPVIAYRAGCLTQSAVGFGSLVLEADDDTDRKIMRQLATWAADPEALARASEQSLNAAVQLRERAISEAVAVGARLFRQNR
jgi:glycosyltransferase involved in cell wall biosynthesis